MCNKFLVFFPLKIHAKKSLKAQNCHDVRVRDDCMPTSDCNYWLWLYTLCIWPPFALECPQGPDVPLVSCSWVRSCPLAAKVKGAVGHQRNHSQRETWLPACLRTPPSRHKQIHDVTLWEFLTRLQKIENVSGSEPSETTHLEDLGHFALLKQRAVVLNGQDHGHLGVHEGGAIDGFHNILSEQRQDQQKENYENQENSQIPI